MADPWEINFDYFWPSEEQSFSLSPDGGRQRKAQAQKKRSQWEHEGKGSFSKIRRSVMPCSPTFSKEKENGELGEDSVWWAQRVRIKRLWYSKKAWKSFSSRELWESLMHDSAAGVPESFEKTGDYLFSRETSCLWTTIKEIQNTALYTGRRDAWVKDWNIPKIFLLYS